MAKALPQLQTLPCKVVGEEPITVGQKLTLKCDPSNPVVGEAVFSYEGPQKYELAFLGKAEFKNNSIEQVFTSYRPGEHQFDKVMVKLGDKLMGVTPFHLRVNSVVEAKQGQEAAPFPNVDPQKLQVPWWWWALWGALLLGISVACFVKIKEYLDRRKKAQQALAAAEKVLSPKEKFDLAIQKLESREWHSKGEYKKFALELTAILKKSAGEKFKFFAEDMTTEEFFDNLKSKHRFFWDEVHSHLTPLFETMDQIKFAKVETTPENCLSLLDQAKHIGNIMFRGDT